MRKKIRGGGISDKSVENSLPFKTTTTKRGQAIRTGSIQGGRCKNHRLGGIHVHAGHLQTCVGKGGRGGGDNDERAGGGKLLPQCHASRNTTLRQLNEQARGARATCLDARPHGEATDREALAATQAVGRVLASLHVRQELHPVPRVRVEHLCKRN